MSGDQVSALASASQPSLAETLPIREAVSQKVAARNLDRYTGFEQVRLRPPRLGDLPAAANYLVSSACWQGIPTQPLLRARPRRSINGVEVIDHQARVPFLLQSVLTPFTPTLGNAGQACRPSDTRKSEAAARGRSTSRKSRPISRNASGKDCSSPTSINWRKNFRS